MLRNLVNWDDVRRVAAKVRRHEWQPILRRMGRTPAQRVVDTWDGLAHAGDQWWDIPSVRQRWRGMIGSRPDEDFVAHAVRTHLSDRAGLVGLSVGCGVGEATIRWARTGVFARIDGFDASSRCVESARRAAAEAGLRDVLHFEVADVSRFARPDGSYDVAMAEQSLHHFSPLRDAILRVRAMLKPNGLFFVDEYVGPNLNQWTPRQLEAANALLAGFPARYRVTPAGEVKTRVVRVSRLGMRLRDPSEAIESEAILPLLREHFVVEEERGYGGALLHPLFARIAHNFQDDVSETHRLLKACFDEEDRLLRTGEIGHDFVVAACRRP